MTAAKWHEGPMVAFDTETTGIDTQADRVVTAAIVHTVPGSRPSAITWLIDPGVDIPDEAAAVHGWTTTRIRDRLQGAQALRIVNGQERTLPREAALFEIAGQIASAMGREAPVVAANASYDLTLLEAELARHDIDTITSRPAGIRGVVDVMVLDKQHDPYRKGCYKAPGCRPADGHHECGGCRGGKHACGGCGATDRKLTSLCAHYGVRHTGAHDATADALAAVRLVPRLVEGWPEIGRWKLPTLHGHQVTWKRQQAESLASFWKRTGDERWSTVDGGWPLLNAASQLPVGGAA